MKSKFRSAVAQTIFYAAPLALCFAAPSMTEAKDPDRLGFGFVTPKKSGYSAASMHGYLSVSIESDQSSDAWYFPQSVYAIYTAGGTLVRNVATEISPEEQIPDIVRLPPGKYIVAARSNKGGYVRLPVIIKTGEKTRLDLDLRDKS